MLKNEDEFVNKYIIEECELMVKGLEDILANDAIFAKDKHNGYYKIDKIGHYLIEYRGEKISGALDFVSKILTLKSIIGTNNFIKRVENLNSKMLPILTKELDYIKPEIEIADEQMRELKPRFQALVEKNRFYVIQKQSMRAQMVESNKAEPNYVNTTELNKLFMEKFIEYPGFETDFIDTSEKYYRLSDHIVNLNRVLNSISSYVNKINNYFK